MTQDDGEFERWLRVREPVLRDRMVEHFRYLCRRGARRFSRKHDDYADFEQIAAVGLIKALDRYRADLQTPFEAYAWIVIQGELMHYVRDCERFVRPPRRLRELERRWRESRDALLVQLEREPTDDEIARHLNVAPQLLRELREYRERANVASLDGLSAKQTLVASYTMDAHDDQLVLEGALRHLSAVERTIVEATLLHDRSINEIAQETGYSQRHVSRLRLSAFRKMMPHCVFPAS